MNSEIRYQRFTELTNEELYRILQLRSEVFVVEQDCAYQDIDGLDQISVHCSIVEGEDLAAYLRYFMSPDDSSVMKLGRVIVAEKYRGKKLGAVLIADAIDVIKQTDASEIFIAAQAHLQKFYSDLGFVTCSEVYDLDNIDHVDMVLKF
ncbi:GNAT family N-acetyltransferase [Kordiimonas sp. SCSIO 12603]|uniref:GNAT family N-acetyltransferase n=1 Tax=Kordiimonas sp. SCSIO 12603 TaxID=2829596 RepID=UPI002107B809|nr:GNAT family N-acetyltransferase [Kordiimonas sp. SCSIO 12603]UTW58256.1 GNAT family N-acetyltransferase [Kordiimonas sp. SCSIO 12603]